MATAGVLEKSEKRAYLDDTTPLHVIIVNHRVKPKENYVEYVMKVYRGFAQDESWEVRHRYSDFSNLAAALQPSEVATFLPPKKMFGASDQQFLRERQQGLEKFLAAILSNPLLSSLMEVKKFLDPASYTGNFYQTGLTSVSMFFRSEPSWKIVEPLRNMGWRIRKQYSLIQNKADPKMPIHLLSWCEPGPDFSMGLKEVKGCLRVLVEMQHPFILSPTKADFDDTGFMIVRQFNPAGSLKDAIYEKTPKNTAMMKYSLRTRIRKLSINHIKQYGRQILEALNFLAEKGFVMGHVHAGNVLIVDGNCKLVDIENTVMGVPSIYRPYLVDIKRLRSHAGETVYGFGQMLYEMCDGAPLNRPTIDTCPSTFPREAAEIIESILSPKAFKEGLPTLADLLSNPFFPAGYGVPASEKPSLRVPSKLKEALKVHLEKAEQRLFAEQKKVAQHQRISKVHENLMSEDEKKKRKKMRKKQMSLQEEEEPLQAYPTTTSLPRQNTIGTSGVTAGAHVKKQATSTAPPTTNGTTSATTPHSNTNSSNSKNAPAKTKAASSAKAPPPPTSSAPEPRPAPPANRGERGALLGSIEGFTKGKLKKTVTNDRSGPLFNR